MAIYIISLLSGVGANAFSRLDAENCVDVHIANSDASNAVAGFYVEEGIVMLLTMLEEGKNRPLRNSAHSFQHIV